jgi:anti-sigma regulatory factor (Ser/Thr protein kinase)
MHIYDWGATFGPEGVAPPNFDGSRDSGFGLFIIAQSVDEVRYSCDASGRNCVSMVKILGQHDERVK